MKNFKIKNKAQDNIGIITACIFAIIGCGSLLICTVHIFIKLVYEWHSGIIIKNYILNHGVYINIISRNEILIIMMAAPLAIISIIYLEKRR